MEQSAFKGGISGINIGSDDSVVGRGTSVSIDVNQDMIGVDFSEDMFRNSMSGTVVIDNTTGWDAKLDGVQGTEWITFSFNCNNYIDGEKKPYSITQRFKVYKVAQSIDKTNQLTTYVFNFTTYQFLIDSLKFEAHLNYKHIGPISTDSNKSNGNLTDQDYGLVNKIFDTAGFDLDINNTSGKNLLDIEPTSNWINYIPSYIDDRNNPEYLGSKDWSYNSSLSAMNNNSENSESRPRKVFELLNELAENSVSQENPNAANFFAWHDLTGWHFRSIDSYLRNRENEVDKTYTYDISGDDSDQEISRIVDLNIIRQVDFMDLLNKQALSSKVIYYELNPDNDFAAYYATLPATLGGLQKVIGPNGLDDSVGNTVIEAQAIIEASLEYDYLKDYDKWSSVEQYPLIRSDENQYTKYTQPSFLEIPPVYLQEGIGKSSWFNSSPYDINANELGQTNASSYTNHSFDQTNPQEFFKTKFARQSDLSGEKFRIVHDKIKMPIIQSLKEYYLACLQRIYFEHNLVIMSGVNTLEAGEGTLGRGPDKGWCEYCDSRQDQLSYYQSQLTPEQREELETIFRHFPSMDTPENREQILLGNLPVPGNGYILQGNLDLAPSLAGRNLNRFSSCTRKQQDTRYRFFGNITHPKMPDQERMAYYNAIPRIDIDVVPRLKGEYIGKSYPRCENEEPLLPYSGDHVDCVTLRDIWNNIPSECALITQHLGQEYCSPRIRGIYGDPVNWNNSIFWNGYWINPRLGLPNIRNFRSFFSDHTNEQQQFFESRMFIKDFPGEGGGNSGIPNTQLLFNNVFFPGTYDSAFDPNNEPSHFINVEGMNFNTTENDVPQTIDVPEALWDELPRTITVARGDGSTRTFSRNITVSYSSNATYKQRTTCEEPRLCGFLDVAEESITVPYVKEYSFVTRRGSAFFSPTESLLNSSVISTIALKWPALWSNGLPYNYGAIAGLSRATSDNLENRTEFLRQFGRNSYNNVVPVTWSGSFGYGNAYYPNEKLQLYDASRPIYNNKDWQNFLDCNGTCVGTDNVVTDTSKSVEYAKYCSYAWNRYWSTPKEQPIYRRAQVALIQAQEIEITVPNDMNLSIGNLVAVTMPRSKSREDPTGISSEISRVNPVSGRYLVTGIRRVFDGSNTSAMKVRLNRDSLPYDPS
jgi:hypothetical protein